MSNACFAEVYYKRYGKKIPVSAEYKNIATYSGHLFSTKTRKSYGMGKQ